MVKLYCYIDETGQDTEGKFYIVVAVVSDAQREKLTAALELAEQGSGKGRRKWHKNSDQKRQAYIERALTADLRGHVFYEVHEGPLSFEPVTDMVAANALRAYRRRRHIGEDYKATVIIDGLPRSLQNRVGKHLRELGVRVRAVRGERDETSPIIRLADAVAGLVREAHEGNESYQSIRRDLEKRGIIAEL